MSCYCGSSWTSSFPCFYLQLPWLFFWALYFSFKSRHLLRRGLMCNKQKVTKVVSFHFREDPFSEGGKINFNCVAPTPPQNVCQFPFIIRFGRPHHQGRQKVCNAYRNLVHVTTIRIKISIVVFTSVLLPCRPLEHRWLLEDISLYCNLVSNAFYKLAMLRTV